MKKIQNKLLWHEQSNYLAIATINPDIMGLPLVFVLDEEYDGMNPFLAYPLSILKSNIGWIEIGNLDET